MTKQQAISALILAAVAEGKSVKEAVDAVLGTGTFDHIASEIWEAANREAA